MPAQKRVIKGTVPARPAVNKTAQFVAGIAPEHPGHQAFYREALADIPHPLEAGKTITYGGLQDLMAGPQRAAALEAYRAANRLPAAPSPEVMQQALFDQARGRMLAKGAANPNALAFPEQAVAALNAPVVQRQMAQGDYLSPANPQQVSSPALQAERLSRLPVGDPAYAAPGMAVAVPPVPARRVITRTLATK